DRRGRKSTGLLEARQTAARAAMYYHGVRGAQKNPNEYDATFVAFVEECSQEIQGPMANSELSWRIVSIIMHGHEGKHKSLANLVSKHAPLSSSQPFSQK
ncbi:MAG: hypothetical protein AAF340_14665, partial [Pseudomonadota bacterium]